jgi:peptidoglycan/LPS O-acetylase OafA/YrhL
MSSNRNGICSKQHLEQIDILRFIPMVGVVLVHTIAYTQPSQDIVANGFLMFLHTNRYVFFFIQRMQAIR